jgi:hypothetical protein
MTVFWGVALCWVVKIDQCFRIWSQYVSLKHWYLPTSLHGVTTQNNNTVIFTAVKASNFIHYYIIINGWVLFLVLPNSWELIFLSSWITKYQNGQLTDQAAPLPCRATPSKNIRLHYSWSQEALWGMCHSFPFTCHVRNDRKTEYVFKIRENRLTGTLLRN